MHTRTVSGLATAAIVFVGLSAPAFAAVDFTGTYRTTDTQGQPMQITLGANGKAWGKRPGEKMKGAWAAGKHYALINWSTGWSTKLVKRGDHFKKLAYAKGEEPKGKPVNKARAVKVQ
jgi:hypothetical protein